MQRIIYLSTIVVTALLGWVVFISPAITDYRDARANQAQAQQEYKNVKESGYRVSESDIQTVERALGNDFALPLRNLEYAITQQDESSLEAVGPDYNLGVALAAIAASTTSVDPTYGILVMPPDVAPIMPLEQIGFRYSLGNSDVRIAVNKKA